MKSSEKIQHINPEGLMQSPAYTHVVRHHNLLFLSGQVSVDAEGNLIGEGDMRAQVRQVLENMRIALASQGTDLSRVVKITIYTTDMDAYLTTGDIQREYWLSYNNCCIVRFDPRTGESKAYDHGNGGGYGIAVDHSDDTVWYSPANRLDPETGLVDRWKGAGGGSLAFDTKGNLWMANMGGSISKWDRQTNTIMRWGVPVERSNPYGMIVDYTDKVWIADYFTSGVTRFDPETETFKHFKIVDEEPTSIRRLGVDANNMIWAATYGNPGRYVDGKNIGGSLFRLNPDTGEVMERNLGIAYSNPYNAEADPAGNIWVIPDNYLVKYDPVADTFTRYPAPTRTDFVRTRITRDGAVWTVFRNAGHYVGYGGVVAALYPDKDKITTLAAYHPENGAGHHASKYRGPSAPKVTGQEFDGSSVMRNAAAYEEWALANGLTGPGEGRVIRDTE